MSADEQRLRFWLGTYLFLNTFSFVMGTGYIWFPLMLMAFHFGRLTQLEDSRVG